MVKLYEYAKLKGKITELFGSQRSFAEAIGVSEQWVSAKLNCNSAFNQEDVEKWAEALQIERKDFGIYFFA